MSTGNTKPLRVLVPAVKIPMMPKGVEHKWLQRVQLGIDYVKIPMMPKGVEHVNASSFNSGLLSVKIPMMPKGVEHNYRGRGFAWKPE